MAREPLICLLALDSGVPGRALEGCLPAERFGDRDEPVVEVLVLMFALRKPVTDQARQSPTAEVDEPPNRNVIAERSPLASAMVEWSLESLHL